MGDESSTTTESIPPDQDEDSIRHTVPDYFVHEDEPAARAKVGWTGRNLGLSDDFYARFLRVPEARPG